VSASTAGDGAGHRCYFEDVEVGVPLLTPAITLTEAHVTLYAGLTGEGRGAEPGRAPDLLPLCLSSGLGWRVPQPPLVVLAFMGFEWEFRRPVRVGDTIRSRSVTVAKRGLRDGGVVVEQREILDQRDQVVQAGRLTLLVGRRPAGRAP
jgi:acyl dehydratase